ncbi:MAG TPA: outer membrane beta-barrel protein [Gemmatimonas sp.]|nr:outer membrane beta-barrel protein [Gemmatimonas sp.]
MIRLRTMAAVAALTMTASATAAAQTCIGLPDLTVTRASLGAEAQFNDGATAYTGRLGLNSRTAFGGISVGYASYSDDEIFDDDVSATTFGGDIGLERHIGTTKRMHVCPIFSLLYQSGPNFRFDGDEVKGSGIVGSLGVALGASFPLTPTLSMVPFGRAGLSSVRSTAESLGVSETETETGGLLGLGASFRFNDIFAITPSVAIPVGFDDADATFSLGVTLGFRRR